jgi:hypothetical protein
MYVTLVTTYAILLMYMKMLDLVGELHYHKSVKAKTFFVRNLCKG